MLLGMVTRPKCSAFTLYLVGVDGDFKESNVSKSNLIDEAGVDMDSMQMIPLEG